MSRSKPPFFWGGGRRIPLPFENKKRQQKALRESARGLISPRLYFAFQQGKFEFINDIASLKDLQTEQEIQRFKNESLGMAVLHLSHIAIKKGVSLEEVARKYR